MSGHTGAARAGTARAGGTRASAVAAAVALTVGITAGCSGGFRVGAKPTRPPVQPGTVAAPAGAASSAPAAQTCDPAAVSLRPTGADANGPSVQQIKRNGKLRVGVSQDGIVTGYRNAAGQEEGFDIDIARQIELALFGTTDDAHIQFIPVTLAQRISYLQNGAADPVDIVVDTMTITCTRAQQVDFSTVYYEASQRLLVLKNAAGKATYPTLADMKPAQKVCVQVDSTSESAILAHPGHPRLYEVKDLSDCLVALQQNDADAVSTDDVILAGLTIQDGNTLVTGPPIEQEPYGIAMSKSTPDLVRYVNGVLEQIRANGTWTTIYDTWFQGPLKTAGTPPLARYAD